MLDRFREEKSTRVQIWGLGVLVQKEILVEEEEEEESEHGKSIDDWGDNRVAEGCVKSWMISADRTRDTGSISLITVNNVVTGNRVPHCTVLGPNLIS